MVVRRRWARPTVPWWTIGRVQQEVPVGITLCWRQATVAIGIESPFFRKFPLPTHLHLPTVEPTCFGTLLGAQRTVAVLIECGERPALKFSRRRFSRSGSADQPVPELSSLVRIQEIDEVRELIAGHLVSLRQQLRLLLSELTQNSDVGRIFLQLLTDLSPQSVEILANHRRL